jgi:hypothetical protein
MINILIKILCIYFTDLLTLYLANSNIHSFRQTGKEEPGTRGYKTLEVQGDRREPTPGNFKVNRVWEYN